MIIAHFSSGFFHLKYAISTEKEGIACVPLEQNIEYQFGAYRIPPELHLNTVVIIGIAAAARKSVLNFEAHGRCQSNAGNVVWDRFFDSVAISNTTQPMEFEEITESAADFVSDSQQNDGEYCSTELGNYLSIVFLQINQFII